MTYTVTLVPLLVAVPLLTVQPVALPLGAITGTELVKARVLLPPPPMATSEVPHEAVALPLAVTAAGRL
jgi:hypothetical protein